MKFKLTKEQKKKFLKWKASKGTIYCGLVGGCYTFSFTSTGIGMIVEVSCSDGTKLDLTEYENF